MKFAKTQVTSTVKNSLLIYGFAISMQFLTACAPQNDQSLNSELSGESIVAGTLVTEKDSVVASTVAILIESHKGVSLCTGTIIAKNVVLTAAHCFAEGASRAVVLFGTEVDKSKTYLPVDRVIVHPEYQSKDPGQGGWNDISILHFKGDAPASSNVAEVLKDTMVLKMGLQAVAAGYGSTPKNGMGQDSGLLRKVTLTLKDPAYEKTELLFPLTPKGGSTCHGDSGGPIYIQQKGKLVLIGVTSRGTAASCDNVSIFTNVVPHAAFLQESIKSLIEEKVK